MGLFNGRKVLGGSQHDFAYSVDRTNDGGYIVAGQVLSSDGDVGFTYSEGYYDAWLIKLDANYHVEWKKVMGGSKDDAATSIIQTEDGGLYFLWLFLYPMDFRRVRSSWK
jgi:hypothetical protein